MLDQEGLLDHVLQRECLLIMCLTAFGALHLTRLCLGSQVGDHLCINEFLVSGSDSHSSLACVMEVTQDAILMNSEREATIAGLKVS